MKANNLHRIIILNDVLATTLSFQESGGVVYVHDPATGGKEAICRRLDIIVGSAVKTVYAAAANRVATIAFTDPAAVGQVYSISIETYPTDGEGVTGETLVHNFAIEASATTNDSVAIDIKAAITAAAIGITPTEATGTLTLTGSATARTFRVVVRDPGAGAVLTYTVAGTPEVNLGSQINAKLPAWFPTSLYANAADEHTTYEWRFNGVAGESMGSEVKKEYDFLLVLNSEDAEYAAVADDIDNMLQGLNAAGTAASSEALGIIS